MTPVTPTASGAPRAAARTRDPWLDNAKTVLVVLVVVGHAIGVADAASHGRGFVYDFLYLWHIPAFVFISGYLSRSFRYDARHLKGLLFTLLVPFLIFEPALYFYRLHVIHDREEGMLWLQPHWTMWYLIVLLLWRLMTPLLTRHWLALPASVVVSLAGGLITVDYLMLPRVLGLLPFFVLGLYVRPHHLARLDDRWVRVAAVGAFVGIALMAVVLDDWASTALLWWDQGYSSFTTENEVLFQTRLTVMMLGAIGTFSVLALVPRRRLGWFTTMGSATMVVYLFHGFAVKTAEGLGWPGFTVEHPVLGVPLTVLGAIALALLLASPPVRRVLTPLADPVTTWLRRPRAR